MSWVWAILLLLFLLAGFVFVIFLFLFALKKNFSLIGLCISGGLMAVFFFGFVVAGALSAIDAMDDASNIETTSTTQSEEDDQVSENTIDTDNKESFDLEYDTYYEIGEDIPEGEYILVGEENAFLEISSDDSGDIESVIHNDVLFEDQFTYLTFENGQYFSFNNAELFTIDNAPTLKPEDGIYQSGMYKVGEDIPAGTYEVVYDEENSELDSGYVEVAKNSGHDARDIIENDIVEDSTEVTIENGQYITLRDMMIDTNK